MPLITVFRFKYFDPSTETFLEAADYATEKAIRELGGIKLAGTGIVVDNSRVGHAGLLIRNDRSRG